MALVVAGAGCGGGGRSGAASSPTTAATAPAASRSRGKQEYERRMQVLGTTLARTLQALGKQNDENPANDAANLRRAISELRTTARKLRAITPPPEVRTLHAELTRAVDEFASELPGVIRRVKQGDVQAINGILRLAGVKAMEKASTGIEKKGYGIVERG